MHERLRGPQPGDRVLYFDEDGHGAEIAEVTHCHLDGTVNLVAWSAEDRDFVWRYGVRREIAPGGWMRMPATAGRVKRKTS